MNLDDAKMYALVHNRQKCECEDIYRLVQKHDTEANWNKAVNFKPKAGELIVYDVDDTHLAPRLKVGDGKTVVFDLPFFFEGAIAELSQKLDKEIIDRIKAVSDAINAAAEDATLKSDRAVTLANSYTDNSVANEAAERARDVSTLSAEITRETTRALNAEDSLSTRIDELIDTSSIQNGQGFKSVQQKLDTKYSGVVKAASKNPYAKVLYPELTDAEPLGAIGDYSASFGGNSSVQAKRGIGGGTSSVTKGAYSQSLGDNTVTTPKATDSTAIGYQTTTDAPAAFTHGSFTAVMSQKYVEGMFDSSTTPGQGGSGLPSEPSTTPTDTLEMDSRRGEAASAGGFNSYSSGFAAEVDGVSNVADGHISKASGRSNRAWSYLSKVDGKNSAVKPSSVSSSATGEGSWANGDGVQIIGAKYAYGGGKNISIGDSADYSFAYGENLAITAPHQVRFGKNSKNLGNDIFTVSNGRDSGYPNDAFTIKSSGEVLIPYTPTSDNGVIRKIDLKDYAAISNLKNYDYVISNGIYAYQSKKADDIGDPKGSIQQHFTNLQLTKLDASAIQQTIGSSSTNVMSQKAVTDSLNNKVNYTDIDNGLAVVDGKVKANIAKIQDSSATEFTPDENGVVTIPNAGKTTSGLIKVDSNFGLAPVMFSSTPKGTIAVAGASDVDIGKRTNAYKPITPYKLNLAVKAAFTDDKRIGTETTDPTTFTDTEKDRACEILGAARTTALNDVVNELRQSTARYVSTSILEG